ncbi:LysM domain-containing protein [Marinobacter sp. LV10R510-11A]|uniref:LysM peptidoglycan-binding domain-containing protein n=1 Tax=Marinobacter sp. LV10R510-11A TaxID=1415568 RepID=UPI000BB6932A|nr:LysM domain-containing protein [Marinobacter sp. LV10R510-11A]SOB78223.1 LysM domain-containing protein [Marinobacter sp. LV10R510-11A]
MQQHKVQAGETLSGIASRYKVSLGAIKAENPIIEDVNHIETGWNLLVPTAAEPTKSLPPAQSANDDSSDDTECSDCALECVALVQLTDDDEQVFALTEIQLKELEEEIRLLNEPIAELAEAEKGVADKIPEARAKAWGKLKALGALPKPDHSTTARELLADYEARWKREQERLEHQRRRKKRINYEIDNVRNQILIPGRERNFQNPRDKLSLQFFTVYCSELESTLDFVDNKIKAHEEATKSSEQDLTRMDERLKLLRAALEAEIEYRVAEKSEKSKSTVAQLRYEADELKEATLWPSYISETDVADLASKTKRFRELDDDLLPYMDYVIEYSTKVSPVIRLVMLMADDTVQPYRKRQEERRSLMTGIEKKLRELVDNSTPVEHIARPQVASMKRHPLVEIKHTGTGGYRYMRREMADQLRRNWKSLKTSDVRTAMQAKDFKRAWGDAKEALKTSKTLSLKLGEWKNKDDNFFNRLEVELLKKEVSTEDGRFAASAEAQMFRFAAQCGLANAYDPEKNEAYIGGKLEGAYSLMQGEAVLKAQIPNELGSELILKYENHEGNLTELNCGYFRADAEYRIRGFAGACASLAARATISSAPGNVGISGETNGEAFAGASLSNEATFGVKWKGAYQKVTESQPSGSKPGSVSDKQRDTDSQYLSLLEVKGELAVSAGIGGGFDFRIGLQESKLVAYVKGHLVLGPGGGGGIAAELNGAQIWELVKFVRWSLEQSDFRFLDWIDDKAFEHLSFLIKAFAVSKEDVVSFFSYDLFEIQSYWENLNAVGTRVRDIAQGVLENGKLTELTPLTKAELLDTLLENSSGLLSFQDPYREIADQALIEILETIDRHREFVEVLKRMGNEKRKGGFQDLKNNYAELIVKRLFRSALAERAETWLSTLAVR